MKILLDDNYANKPTSTIYDVVRRTVTWTEQECVGIMIWKEYRDIVSPDNFVRWNIVGDIMKNELRSRMERIT